MTAPRRLRLFVYSALIQAWTAVDIAFVDRYNSRRVPQKKIWQFLSPLPALSSLIGTGFILERRYKRLREQSDEETTEKAIGQLSNPRWEAFAQLIAAGRSATAAYAQAYGRDRDAVSRVNGRRLRTNANIQERIAEIRQEAAAASASTLEKVIEELGCAAVKKIQHGSFKQACETAGQFSKMVISLADAAEGIGSAK